MSEKRGSTGKLIYDFQGTCCEIKVNNDYWHRVTEREFRSFDGDRRLVSYDNQKQPIYNYYDGPVYLYKTNSVVERKNTGRIRFEADADPRENQQPTARYY
jgi:hypothetical protein